jgi:group I intron endonuclease
MYSFSYVTLPKEPGIYRIKDRDSSKFYIGSSINIKRRVTQHIYRLNRGDHSNPIMQSIWNKDPCRLYFECVKLVKDANKQTLLELEQKYLDKAKVGKNKNCMNILLIANSHLGVKRRPESIEKLRKVHIGRKASEETRAKQRAAKLGKKQSPEHVFKRTSGQKGKSCNRPKGIFMNTLRKLSDDQVRELRKLKLDGASYSDLQSKYHLAIGTLQRIISKQSYADIE